MKAESLRTIVERFQKGVVGYLVVVLALIMLASVAVLSLRFVRNLAPAVHSIEDVGQLQEKTYTEFGGVLIVLLGLELLETMMVYFREHRIRVEVILIVALIPLGRHIIELDAKRVPGLTLLGVAALTPALSGSHFLVRRAGRD